MDPSIRRRKSPALWRHDLISSLSDPQALSSVAASLPLQLHQQQPQSLPLLRLPAHPPEVMSPAGGWPQLRAAVANGADAVYLGLTAFSARARATNFDPYDRSSYNFDALMTPESGGGGLVAAVQYCHAYHVKVYVALNTLVFDSEIEEVARLLQRMEEAQVDAVIIQDLGLAALAHRLCPSLVLHASTQQSITDADGAIFATHRYHTARVVVGRELSVEEISTIVQQTTMWSQQHQSDESSSSSSLSAAIPVEIETFVHGALCVSYSGQCFSSEAWGGRSANRGQCAQACRLPYGLIRDGELFDLQDMSYLLSPQDLCGLDQVPQLVRAGVTCLKIEGRLKDATYVAATTRAYRHAVDQAWADLVQEYSQANETGPENASVSAVFARKTLDQPDLQVTKWELVQMFSRGQDENHDGLSPGFLEGVRHQRLVVGRSPRHRGVHVGYVAPGSSYRNGIVVTLDATYHEQPDMEAILKRGDGIVVDRGRPQEDELGGPVFDVQPHFVFAANRNNGQKRQVAVKLGRDVERRWKQDRDLVPVGAHVWKTFDSTVDKKMRRLSTVAPPRAVGGAVRISVSGRVGEHLTVTLYEVGTGCVAVGRSPDVLTQAERAGLSPENIRKAVGTLGNTQWTLGVSEGINDASVDTGIDVSGVDTDAWCPISWIKRARSQAVEELEALTKASDGDDTHDTVIAGSKAATLQQITPSCITKTILKESIAKQQQSDLNPEVSNARNQNPDTAMRISVLARSLEQVDAVCSMLEREEANTVDEIIVDFLEVDGMRDAVDRIRRVPRLRAVVASPRILKPGEAGIWRTLLRLEPDGLLIRSAGLLQRMKSLGGKGASVDVGYGLGSDNGDGPNVVAIPQLLGDFSLNAANALTAMEMLDCGLDRIAASYDLNAASITTMATFMGPLAKRLEVIAHTKMPIFHTEHCVFARFLSKGDSYLNCGHVCTRHTVHLRDQTGADNLVLADMGCRNTVFAAQSQSGVHSLGEWENVGRIERIRLELVDEGPEDSRIVVKGYHDVLVGDRRPNAVWDDLDVVKDSNGRAHGVSLGSFRNSAERRAGEL